MKYKVVILDLDNTLIDFDKMEIASFKHCSVLVVTVRLP